MRQIIVLFLLFFSAFASAEGYRINLKIDSGLNKKVKLAYYYVGNIYLKDSLQLDNSGTGVFQADTLLPQGLYKIYLDENNHFDFLLGADQEFSMQKESFVSPDIEITGAVETSEFSKYAIFMQNLQKKGAEINNKLKTASGDEKALLQTEMGDLTRQLHEYWFRVKDEYPNTFLSAFLLANYVPAPDISTFPVEVQKNDSLLLLARFNYQKAHFWDYFDYTDERFLYTPLSKPKLETWFTKVLYQNYDSIKPEVFRFIEDVRPSKRIFQFAVSWFLNASINSNIMGMDALFVDLARTYYFSGQAFWTTEEAMKKIRENVAFAEHNLIGKIAPDLTLENIDGEFVNLHKTEAKITIVLIYEPDCSHCKEFVPHLHNDVYQQFKHKGLKVYAIYSMDKKDEWSEFLTKHNLYDWINVWDENHISQFKILYDGRKTPAVYILDENKKIIAKSITVEQIKSLMENIL
ncbi:MAG: redoxin domain-containing protein [Bacteroidetes bacterium]|nr:MAG: redoxin domain-containing protein [Bacteroidota bacterium]